MMAATQSNTESLFLSLSSYENYDPSRKVRRESRSFPSVSIAANSFSYSSGFELNSPSYTGSNFQDEDTIDRMNQQNFTDNGTKYNRSQAVEEFYNSLRTSDLRHYIGFGSSLSANARSIQNGKLSSCFLKCFQGAGLAFG